MFTSDGANVLSMFFGWIWQIANMRLPGLAITLWQLFAGMIMISFILRLAIELANTRITNLEYHGSSYHSNKTPYEPKVKGKANDD